MVDDEFGERRVLLVQRKYSVFWEQKGIPKKLCNLINERRNRERRVNREEFKKKQDAEKLNSFNAC
jgi:hypothetical protein